MKYVNSVFCILFMLFVMFGCKDKYEPPKVSTDSINFITHNSALINCSIITFGDTDHSQTREGICYNTTGNPTVNDHKITDKRWNDTLPQTFTNYIVFLPGLHPNTTYYLKSFIEHSEGIDKIRSISYGKELILTTQDVDSIVDARDNQVYKVIKIGSQVWMAENLNYKPASGSYEYETEADKSKYGRLYTYEAGNCACPDGWHLPSDAEWQILEKEMGMPDVLLNEMGQRGDSIARKIKEPGSSNWINNIFSTNNTAFTALPGGLYSIYDSELTVDYEHAFFLTSTLNEDSSKVINRILYSFEDFIERSSINMDNGLSVRCIKN